MTNLVLQNDQAIISWLDTGGTNLLTLTSLATLSGHQGAQHDFTANARARQYAWRAFVKFATTPVVGEVIEIYWKTEAGSGHPDNDDGTGDIALSAEDKLRNLHPLGVIIVDEASTSPEFVGSGVMEAVPQKGQPVFFNRTVDALSSTASDHGFQLIPVPDEIQ